MLVLGDVVGHDAHGAPVPVRDYANVDLDVD
jgi:hypothetical protein